MWPAGTDSQQYHMNLHTYGIANIFQVAYSGNGGIKND